MNNPLIYQVAAGLLFLFFASATYMFAKTWKWHHILAAWCVFFSAVTFTYYAAVSARTRVTWVKLFTENETKLGKLTEERLKLMHDVQELGENDQSLRSIRNKIARELVERGRVWRGCERTATQPDGTVKLVVLKAAPAAPPAGAAEQPADPAATTDPAAAGDAAAAPAPVASRIPKAESHGIEPKSVVYAFLEGQQAQLGMPTTYLGEYRVTATTDTDVTLSPVIAPAANKIPPGEWTLYEAIPIDSYDVFSDPESRPDDDNIFGKVSAETIRSLMPKLPRQANDKYEAKINEYVRNGTTATDVDPPEHVWFRVRFLKEHSIDVDAESIVSLTENRFFDNTGRAIVPTLQRGEPVKFNSGDMAIFHQEFANQLVSQQVAEKVKSIYIRKLKDYWLLFHEVRDQLANLEIQIEQVKRNGSKLDDANKRVLTQVSVKEQERKKLQEDVVKATAERDALAQYVTILEARWAERKAIINDLYRRNLALQAELNRLSQQRGGPSAILSARKN